MLNSTLEATLFSWSPPTQLCMPRTFVLSSLHVKLRPFSYAGPHAWNSLAENVRKSTSKIIFNRSLQTSLFEQITHSANEKILFIYWAIQVYILIQQPPKRERDREAHLNYYASAYNRQRQLSHCKTKLNRIRQKKSIHP